ncbi:sulfurase [Streptomyces abyssalis]|uniref:Sulfurase n=1 Tax=Streptomyces abyssalis TaxID=933944 RepID=A0A1E7JFN5_9ACTN|nr:MOSC domain-containing protein [Streptomyces abyssalis]OEU85284.1 sulfurase [Streptomyces abyssalis]OEU91551.1 sulfurase [Streptomyces abyssalis]OEV30593.1 sulfurase [Streptomyces nanshensis]
MNLLSVNVAKPLRAPSYTDAPGSLTGIDKRPASGPVGVSAPGPKGTGGSALADDTIGDMRHHGGDHQAVYAYAREDLDGWARELGRDLDPGCFGENLTTEGLDVNGARIGERWLIGDQVVLEVTAPRIPCRTFAGWLDERGWVKRFTERALPGAYLRVVQPGAVCAGDGVVIVHRPDHEVTVSFLFRALTREPELLPRVLAAGDALHPEARGKALRRTGG